jgi:uncharacterized protein (TIGR00296 family)
LVRQGTLMMFDLSLEEGAFLVGLARRTIESVLGGGRPPSTSEAPEAAKRHCGVFVTLNKVRGGEHSLRGCIGYPFPVKALADAVVDVANGAAFEDPRFPRVSAGEMDEIVVEVSVLTPPEVVKVDDPRRFPEQVKVGVDGLIIRRGGRSGLLLPQVAVDWEWDAEEFLSQCCVKTGLPPDSWLMPGTEVQKFQALIFAEESPRGTIKRVKIRGC